MAKMFYFIERGSPSIHKWKVLYLAGVLLEHFLKGSVLFVMALASLDLCLLLLTFGSKDQFLQILQGNISLQHLQNEETLVYVLTYIGH